MFFTKNESIKLIVTLGITAAMFGIPGLLGLYRTLNNFDANLTSNYIFVLVTILMIFESIGLMFMKKLALWVAIVFMVLAIVTTVLSVILQISKAEFNAIDIGFRSTGGVFITTVIQVFILKVLLENKRLFN